MPNKQSVSKPPSKNVKSQKKMRLLKWWDSPTGRPLMVLVVIAVVIGGVFAANKLMNHGPSFTRTYIYKKGSAGFSFQYPAAFWDSTKPQVYGPKGFGYVAQQTKKDTSGAIVGFVRGIYSPRIGDNAALLNSIQYASQGSRSALAAFKQSIGSSTYGDCSKAVAFLAASSGKRFVECPLSPDLGTSYKGVVLLGASSTGMYEFDYWIKATYWNEHASQWNGMFKNLSYN